MTLNQINDHFRYYEKAVANYNALTTLLANDSVPEQEKKQIEFRRTYENNTIRLHELFFENINPKRILPSLEFTDKIASAFGNLSAIEQDLVAVSEAEGVGWAGLFASNDSVVVAFIRGSDFGSVSDAGYKPLIIIDCWEHAYVKDFGMQGKKEYVSTLTKYIDWGVVEKRFNDIRSA
ncbi:putative superoxide dismutase [Blattamonas nauphoetae]|uniref:Superoxide dismutase n=1 Tax=Blattamonas nauphoetae TaxID=2049346 RepID=A0ABQ9XYQ8_9EUKA|nr:putative superoxide dismutase [Blattamonas nauphoetae]